MSTAGYPSDPVPGRSDWPADWQAPPALGVDEQAALHHAKLSKHHAFNAHEQLKEVLVSHEKMRATDASALPTSLRGDLLQ